MPLYRTQMSFEAVFHFVRELDKYMSISNCNLSLYKWMVSLSSGLKLLIRLLELLPQCMHKHCLCIGMQDEHHLAPMVP